MNELREKLMNEIMRTLGFENEWTIWFCQICEDVKATDEMILLAYNHAIESAIDIEEE